MIPVDLERLTPRQRIRLTKALSHSATPIDRLFLAPHRAMETPDAWQTDLLSQLITRDENALVMCSRGAGKTRAVSVAAYVEAVLGGFAFIVSRSDRQAMKVFRYVVEHHKRLNLATTVRQTMHELEFENGGKVFALPCREDTIRSEHGVTLLVIDEAARVPDPVYGAVTAMTGTSGGRVVLLSTPWGRRGFFHKEWIGEGDSSWRRHRYSWHDCPRLTEAFIETERRRHGSQWVAQEYLDCNPGDEFQAIEGGVFDVASFAGLVDPTMEVLEW